MRLTDNEIELGRFCIEEAVRCGASQARAALNKSTSDTYSMLDGELDKVTHTADSSIFIYLFVDGRYGTYSTNRLDRGSLRRFISHCVSAARLLAPDSDYRLPDRALCNADTGDGTKMGLYDPAYYEITDEQRLEMARMTCLQKDDLCGDGWKVVSCESEYGDFVSDSVLLDSNGVFLRSSDTGFTVSTELTIEDCEGRKYNSFWWDSSASPTGLGDLAACPKMALKRALSQMNPVKSRGGKRRMVVDSQAASRLVAPIINSLYGDNLYQKNSFLTDRLGKKVFPEHMTLMDLPLTPGAFGARLYDSEGVATRDRAIIDKGVISSCFINTYYSAKLNLPQTIGSPSVPTLLPCAADGVKGFDPSGRWDREAICKAVGNGILVTGFNGGNCNDTTGDFSYGIEGFVIKNGKIAHPVREMLITGNFLDLWNGLLAVGNDPRRCTRWQIPTLAFASVSFSA